MARRHQSRYGHRAHRRSESDRGLGQDPAEQPGSGINGQDFVSMSGGGGRVLNPNTQHPAEAWALMEFMNSHDAVLNSVENAARITQRQDVNDETLSGDPS